MSEKPLHAALKEWYAQPGDRLEMPLDAYVIDIVRGDLLIEIQTRSFAAIRPKLAELVPGHPLRLVYPIAREKWIVKLDGDGQTRLSRRKSPKRGGYEHLFSELVSFPGLLAHPDFTLEVLLTQEEELRRYDSRRAWRRRGWVTVERHLLRVVGRKLFQTPDDVARLLPAALPEPFTTADLAAALKRPRRLAQQMAYCLRQMGLLQPVGKEGNALLYVQTAGRGVNGEPYPEGSSTSETQGATT